MKVKVLELIEALKNDPDFDYIDVYESKLEDWEYFFSIRGTVGNKYFHFEISKLKKYPDSHGVIVASLTDCKEEIEEKLKQFKIK